MAEHASQLAVGRSAAVAAKSMLAVPEGITGEARKQWDEQIKLLEGWATEAVQARKAHMDAKTSEKKPPSEGDAMDTSDTTTISSRVSFNEAAFTNGINSILNSAKISKETREMLREKLSTLGKTSSRGRSRSRSPKGG